MNHNELSHYEARSLPAGKHADGQGLWLVKRAKAKGKWILRLVVYNKRREMGLGRWPDVSISEARTKAELARKALRDGTDPVFERLKAKRAGKPLTLKEAVAGCFEARKAELKADGEAGRWMSPLSVHVVPKIGNYPVEKVDQHVLKELLAPIWDEKPEAAKKALNRIGQTLRHAAALARKILMHNPQAVSLTRNGLLLVMRYICLPLLWRAKHQAQDKACPSTTATFGGTTSRREYCERSS